ncbi:peptidoglycan DD-metalloendopeptidase family protein [Zunongwangia sp.]|uniref:peptidoglycan DD-metalloendopeptidase family protein n=1 Tax=Zunongwangia sp. TaxID=1965325 RepID=UPI003AA7D622
MHKIFSFLLLFGMFSITAISQTSTDYDTQAENLVDHYNAAQYHTIFDSFSAEMKKALPLPETQKFFEKLHSKAGKITDSEFLIFQDPFATYAVTFEKGAFLLNLALSEQSEITGFKVIPYGQKTNLHEAETLLDLPFKEEWYVVWGGDNKEDNRHFETKSQTGAYDFLRIDDDLKTHRGDGSINNQYYAFGAEIFSPASGEVVMAVDGVYDNKPGNTNSNYAFGNTIVLKIAKNEYLYLTHLKNHTLKVKEGDIVKKGDLLGLCGNSGNSSEPHLHMHVQDRFESIKATGLKAFFKRLKVDRKYIENYAPVRGDLVEAI